MIHQMRGDETRARILSSAAECFTHAGYDATGVADICSRAGVSKGAFYHHFPSKQAAFLTLFDQWIGGLSGAAGASRRPGETVPQLLERMADLIESVLDAGAGQIPLFLEFWRQAIKDPEVWAATIKPYRRFRASFSALVSEGVAEGSLRPVDPELAAHVLVSLGAGLVLQGVVDPSASEWRGAADQAIRLLLQGLARERD